MHYLVVIHPVLFGTPLLAHVRISRFRQFAPSKASSVLRGAIAPLSETVPLSDRTGVTPRAQLTNPHK
jgi:transposase